MSDIITLNKSNITASKLYQFTQIFRSQYQAHNKEIALISANIYNAIPNISQRYNNSIIEYQYPTFGTVTVTGGNVVTFNNAQPNFTSSSIGVHVYIPGQGAEIFPIVTVNSSTQVIVGGGAVPNGTWAGVPLVASAEAVSLTKMVALLPRAATTAL